MTGPDVAIIKVDNNLYVVVHTASDYILLEKLQYDFITSFSLGNITDCVYIVNVDTIQGPLFVFKNYGSAGEDRNTLFCTLPQAKRVNILVKGFNE